MSNGPLLQLIPDFYRKKTRAGGRLSPFTLCTVPVPYLDRPSYLKIKSYDPADARPPMWEVVEKLPKAFAGSHHPLKALNLAAHEEFLAYGAKKRPGIPIICTTRGELGDVRSKSFWTPTALVLPVHSFYDSEGRLKPDFSFSFYRNVALLKHRQFFYIPQGGGLRFDGFLRLDRALSLPQKHIEPTDSELGEDARGFLMAYFRAFLNEGDFLERDSFWAGVCRDCQEADLESTETR